tara:strand:- start:5782 stop:6093 length:312 start_codon:yes stop_codon:yes gene_type:complete
MTDAQNTIVYLMFLNGVLFLALNFLAKNILYPGSRGSKQWGYNLVIAVITAFFAKQEYRSLISIEFNQENALKILLGGFIIPIFFISLVYYRIRRNREEKKSS